jgi:hypothetical protein
VEKKIAGRPCRARIAGPFTLLDINANEVWRIFSDYFTNSPAGSVSR